MISLHSLLWYENKHIISLFISYYNFNVQVSSVSCYILTVWWWYLRDYTKNQIFKHVKIHLSSLPKMHFLDELSFYIFVWIYQVKYALRLIYYSIVYLINSWVTKKYIISLVTFEILLTTLSLWIFDSHKHNIRKQ